MNISWPCNRRKKNESLRKASDVQGKSCRLDLLDSPRGHWLMKTEDYETTPRYGRSMMIDAIPVTGPSSFTRKDMIEWYHASGYTFQFATRRQRFEYVNGRISIEDPFSIAMLNYWRVTYKNYVSDGLAYCNSHILKTFLSPANIYRFSFKNWVSKDIQ